MNFLVACHRLLLGMLVVHASVETLTAQAKLVPPIYPPDVVGIGQIGADIYQDLIIGLDQPSSRLFVENGAVFQPKFDAGRFLDTPSAVSATSSKEVSSAIVGFSASSFGNRIDLKGPGSQLWLRGLNLGNHGGSNVLAIATGAQLISGVSIGVTVRNAPFTGSAGNTITVAGNGSGVVGGLSMGGDQNRVTVSDGAFWYGGGISLEGSNNQLIFTDPGTLWKTTNANLTLTGVTNVSTIISNNARMEFRWDGVAPGGSIVWVDGVDGNRSELSVLSGGSISGSDFLLNGGRLVVGSSSTVETGYLRAYASNYDNKTVSQLMIESDGFLSATNGLKSFFVKGGQELPSGSCQLFNCSVTNMGTFTAHYLRMDLDSVKFSFPKGLVQCRQLAGTGSLPFIIGNSIDTAQLVLTGSSNSCAGGGIVITPRSSMTLTGSLDALVQNNGLVKCVEENGTVTFLQSVTNTGVMDFSTLSKVTFQKVLVNKGIIRVRDASVLNVRVLDNTGQIDSTPTASGLEGDIAPRPAGNGNLTAADLTVMGRIVAGLETGLTAAEFQRADCAPLSSRGNGSITAGDLTQVARFVAGLDPQTQAGGPLATASTLSTGSRPVAKMNVGTRRYTLADASSPVGGALVSAVRFTSLGNENAMSFSLSFDPSKITYRGASLASGLSASLILNTNLAATGKIGCVISLPAGQTLRAGTADLLTLNFQAGSASGSSPVAFTSTPAPKSISDALGEDLVASYVDGTISITGAASAQPPVITTPLQNQSVTAGSALVFSVVASGTSPLSYQWRKDGTLLPTASGPSFTVSNLSAADVGTYSVTVSNPSGAANSQAAVTLKTETSASRALLIADTTISPGSPGTVVVRMTAMGNENALSFSISFDATRLTYQSAVLSPGMSSASLVLNTLQAATGKLGVVLSLPAGQTLSRGTVDLINVGFSAIAAGTAPVSFATTPAPQSISDAVGNDLAAAFQNGVVTVGASSTPSVVERQLPSGYTANAKLTVTLKAVPPASTTVYAVEESAPAGWSVGSISDGGAFDAQSKKLKWGPYFDATARNLTYEVTPPAGETGVKQFVGTVSVDGSTSPITGPAQLDVVTWHPADNAPADGRITIAEVTAYGLAWKKGTVWPVAPNPIPIEYVTRAGLLWKNGESYVLDPSVNTAPKWWVNKPSPSLGLQTLRIRTTASHAVARKVSGGFVPGEVVQVGLEVKPAGGVAAYAVQDGPPAGWNVRSITGGGLWDESAGLIKWGPFFDSSGREFSYEAIPPVNASQTARFAGTGSFDGDNVTIGGQVQSTATSRISSLANSTSGKALFRLSGRQGSTWTVQASSNLLSWETIATSADQAGLLEILDPASQTARARFYRLVLP